MTRVNRFSHKSAGWLVGGLLVGSAALAVYAVAFSADGSEADDERPLPEPTPRASAAMSMDEAAQRLTSEVPSSRGLLDAVAARDAEGILNSLDWANTVCLPDGVPGPNSLFCSALGVPPGTQIEVFPQEVGFVLERERSNVADLLERFLAANPRLEMIARREDGKVIVSYATDPWASDITNTTLVGFMFHIAPQVRPVVLIQTVVSSTSALDKVRNDQLPVEESERLQWEFWAISDELQAKDAAKHGQRYGGAEAMATPPAGR